MTASGDCIATSRRLALAMIPIFSLAGVPPLSGFGAKVGVIEGTVAAGAYWVGGRGGVGLLTVLSMGRTWAEGFWRPAPGKDLAASGIRLRCRLPRSSG